MVESSKSRSRRPNAETQRAQRGRDGRVRSRRFTRDDITGMVALSIIIYKVIIRMTGGEKLTVYSLEPTAKRKR
jgi:hypothetical protein